MPHHRQLLPAPLPPSGGACPAPARVAGADPRKPPNHCRLPHLTRCCARRPRPPPLPPLLGVASPPSSPEEEPTPPAPRHQGVNKLLATGTTSMDGQEILSCIQTLAFLPLCYERPSR
ncbi:hypothetical protein PVAP13_1NG365100 [Panicum virgatum]|uniref:Uncharacterized protein n=1 Tax=Panicum virgatum TaxID=38727 RepID=A0A8T0X0L9_PANVG|nr:hypothetical protein PVAP13_1NG365100 [Panicum virgatum]